MACRTFYLTFKICDLKVMGEDRKTSVNHSIENSIERNAQNAVERNKKLWLFHWCYKIHLKDMDLC